MATHDQLYSLSIGGVRRLNEQLESRNSFDAASFALSDKLRFSQTSVGLSGKLDDASILVLNPLTRYNI
jgi:hypothetical protein